MYFIDQSETTAVGLKLGPVCCQGGTLDTAKLSRC